MKLSFLEFIIVKYVGRINKKNNQATLWKYWRAIYKPRGTLGTVSTGTLIPGPSGTSYFCLAVAKSLTEATQGRKD